MPETNVIRSASHFIEQASFADFSSGNTSASAQIAETAAGSQVMDQLREHFSTASDQEEKLFNKHIGQFQNQSFWLLVAVLATLIASAALAMVALLRERQRTAALQTSARALASTNRMLEERVNERTEELAVERDHAKVERERAEALCVTLHIDRQYAGLGRRIYQSARPAYLGPGSP